MLPQLSAIGNTVEVSQPHAVDSDDEIVCSARRVIQDRTRCMRSSQTLKLVVDLCLVLGSRLRSEFSSATVLSTKPTKNVTSGRKVRSPNLTADIIAAFCDCSEQTSKVRLPSIG